MPARASSARHGNVTGPASAGREQAGRRRATSPRPRCSAQPDPYKLLVANTSFTINPHTYATPSPDPDRVHAHRADPRVATGPVRQPGQRPAKNLAEFVAWVKSESAKGAFSYASSGQRRQHAPGDGVLPGARRPAEPDPGAIQRQRAGHPGCGRQPGAMPDGCGIAADPFIAIGKLRPILVTGATRLALCRTFPPLPNLASRTSS